MKRRPSLSRADSARTGRHDRTARVEQLEARRLYAESAATPDVAPAAPDVGSPLIAMWWTQPTN